MTHANWDAVRSIDSFNREELIEIVRDYDRAFINLAESVKEATDEDLRGEELVDARVVLSDLYALRDMARRWPTHALDELLALGGDAA